jgi:hypothetical protein
MGLFKDARDVAITISTDGAQLTMKKQSNVWLLIVVLLNVTVAPGKTLDSAVMTTWAEKYH